MKKLVGAVLLLWEPLNVATEALGVVATLPYRGVLAALELLLHGCVAVIATMGGLALWNGAPDANRLATLAIVLSGARTVQSLYFSSLPSNSVPGSEPLFAGLTILCVLVAAVIIRRR